MAKDNELIWTTEDVLMQFNWMTKLSPEELDRFLLKAEEDEAREAERMRAVVANSLRESDKKKSEENPNAKSKES